MMNFIDLQRQFHKLTDAELAEIDQLVSLSEYEFGPSFDWAELLKFRRVILLAEAGAGKTMEMEEQAKHLAARGMFAFFVPLESLGRKPIPDNPFIDGNRFQQWKAEGQEPAWFFLDAVDELKITLGTLSEALAQLSKDLDGSLGRARVIISSRPSDWHSSLDRPIVEKNLPVPKIDGDTPSRSSDEVFIEALRREFGYTKKLAPDEDNLTDRDAVQIVAMLSMSRRQIKLFVEQSGVSNAAEFLDEIDRHNAWHFARRPLDLIDLIATWMRSGRLGTRAEQHETNITAKLKDRPDRPDRDVLSDTKARHGAECLALALALTRIRTIQLLDQPQDIQTAESIEDDILKTSNILTDWTEAERQALLRRAVFDPATYERVRFHHRSVQEYLAARRLWALRNQGMSTRALFRLLFAERYGVKVVLPSMRAIAAWLALWDDTVRKELFKREPEALLSLGDPGTLDLAARRDLVRAFVAEYGQGDWYGLDISIDNVRRLACPELASVVRECWGTEPANNDLRRLLLQMIRQGPIKECADLAYAAARNPDWNIGHRTTAILALLACGCDDSVRELVDEMLVHPESWPAEIVYNAAPELFPGIITVEELVTLIEKRSRESDWTIWCFVTLPRMAKSMEAGGELATALRDKLAGLIWRERGATQSIYHAQSEFEHLAPVLAVLCERQLAEISGRPSDELIRACVIASRFGGKESGRHEPVGKLRRHFDGTSNWRNHAFWAELAFADQIAPSDDAGLRFHHTTYDCLVGTLADSDRPWLEIALEDEDHRERRAVALCALIQDWHRRGQIPSELKTIRAQLKGDTFLGQLLAQWTAPPERNEKLEKMKREARNTARARDAREAHLLEGWKKWRDEMLADPDNAFSAEKLERTLYNLCQWLRAAKPNRACYGLWDKEALIEAFGPEAAERAEKAFRSLWRATMPVLWSVRPAEERSSMPFRWLYGLQGLLAEASTPGWTASLSSAEARVAAVYATIELDDFAPFVTDLTESHPKEVEAVIGGEVSNELSVGGNPLTPTLQHLAHAEGSLKQLFIPRLITELKSWPKDFTEDAGPNWAHHLGQVLRILGDTKNGADRETIAQECVNRYEADPVGPLALVWLGSLFRFDAVRGTETLIRGLTDGKDPATRERVAKTFAALFGRYDTVSFQTQCPDERARLLGQLVRHSYTFIRPEDDQVHKGVYTPDARDNAETARNYLLSMLIDTPGPMARRIVLELAEEKDFAHFSDRLRLQARQRAATDAEFRPYTPEGVIALNTRYEAPPQDRDGLFDLMMDRLRDLQHDFTHDDFSDRRTVQGIHAESEMQRTLARRIKERANGAYLVTREDEVADRKRTDIRLSTTNSDQKAAIEVKIADNGWTLTTLEQALRKQLVGQYLRPTYCKAGCLLLTYRGEKKFWIHPDTRRRIRFPELVTILKDKAKALQAENQDDVYITVFGLDLTGTQAMSEC